MLRQDHRLIRATRARLRSRPHARFDGARLAWPIFNTLALPGAPLMFTSGTSEGSAICTYCGEPLYHGSLNPGEYERHLASNDFSVIEYRAEDPGCGGHTIWLAKKHT